MSIEDLQKEVLELEQSKKAILKNIEDTKEKAKQAIVLNNYELVIELNNKLIVYSNLIQTTDEKIAKLNSEIDQIKKRQSVQEKIEELKKEAKKEIDSGNYEAIEKITKKIVEYESSIKNVEEPAKEIQETTEEPAKENQETTEEQTTDKKETVYHYNEIKEQYSKDYLYGMEVYDLSPNMEEFIEKHGPQFDKVYLFPPRLTGHYNGKKEETFIKRYNDSYAKPELMINGKDFSIICSSEYNNGNIDEFFITFTGKKGAYYVAFLRGIGVKIAYATDEAIDKCMEDCNVKHPDDPIADRNELLSRIRFGYSYYSIWKQYIESPEMIEKLGLISSFGDKQKVKSIDEIYEIVTNPEFEARLGAVYSEISSKHESAKRSM